MAALIEFVQIIFVLCVALLVALGLLMFFALGITLLSENESETKAQQLESMYAMRQMMRRNQKVELLRQIGMPCENGRYSVGQMEMWNRFDILDAEDKELIRQERDAIIEARGYQGQWKNL